MAFRFVQDEIVGSVLDMKDLRAIGDKLGVPYVPGEDIGEYRKRVIAARDAKK